MYLGRTLSWTTVAIVAATAPLSMVMPNAGSGSLYLLLLIVLIAACAAYRSGTLAMERLDVWRPLAFAVLAQVLILLLAQAVQNTWHPSSFERAFRVAAILPVLWLFLRIRPETLRYVQWGFILAVLYCAYALFFPQTTFSLVNGYARPDTSNYTQYNTVGFANLTFMFGFLTLASLYWPLTPFRRTEAFLKIAIAGLAMAAVVASQTRTSWLALPLYVMVAGIADRRLSWRAKSAIAGILIVLVAVAGTLHHTHDRIGLAFDEARQCAIQPNTESSVCIRFQLWRAAGVMFSEHPWFGVGDGPRFQQALREIADRGIVSQYVAHNWGETHNDMIFVAATYGVTGLLAFLLTMYVVPAGYLIARLRRCERREATAAAMGLIVVFGFLAFGLTEMMFRSMRTISLYIVLLALFLVLSETPESRSGTRLGKR